MEFMVKKHTKYVELLVKDGSTTIESNLLDHREARALCLEMADAISDLLEQDSPEYWCARALIAALDKEDDRGD